MSDAGPNGSGDNGKGGDMMYRMILLALAAIAFMDGLGGKAGW